MAIRVKHKIVVVVAQDEAEQFVHFERSADVATQVIETALEVEESGHFELAASEADYALPLGKVVSGKILYLEADGDVTIKLDSEVSGHTVGANGSGLTAKFFWSGDFSAAPTLTNPDSSNVVTGSYMIAGLKT